VKHMKSNSLVVLAVFLAQTAWTAESPKDLTQGIAEVMFQAAGNHPGYRPVHAKGIVCQGTFEASPNARSVSRAAHFQGGTVPVTVRFSDGGADPTIPDGSPDAAPRGMAIRFTLPDGKRTDIVAISHNGFIVSNGEDFLALQKALVATDPSKPHPWPIETFVGSHPAALKFVQDPKPAPVSFATESFYGNNAFTFVNKDGVKQSGRYQILAVGGAQHLDAAAAKDKSPNFLFEELKTRLADGPAKFRLVLQLASPGDRTDDGTVVWPDDRKTVDLGTITLTKADPDSATAEKALAFDPTRLTDGIELSDDPLPALRSRVYALSVAHRRAR
jgi:catalase